VAEEPLVAAPEIQPYLGGGGGACSGLVHPAPRALALLPPLAVPPLPIAVRAGGAGGVLPEEIVILVFFIESPPSPRRRRRRGRRRRRRAKKEERKRGRRETFTYISNASIRYTQACLHSLNIYPNDPYLHSKQPINISLPVGCGKLRGEFRIV
jgi:hypothetical protein